MVYACVIIYQLSHQDVFAMSVICLFLRTNVCCKQEALAIVIVLSGHCNNAPSSPAT